MKIIVTGGSGFLGKHLIEALLNERHSVIALGREKIPDPRIDSVRYDLLQEPSEEIRNKLVNVDAIVHLAAIMPSKLDKGEDIVAQNLLMTKNALSLADSSKYFIFASSVDVYPYSETLVDEDTSLDPISEYGESKKESEDECLRWLEKNPHVAMTILRFSHLYGPADTNTKGIDVMMRNALLGKKSTIYGEGNQKRTYLFVDDAVRAILLCLKQQKAGIFNVAGSASYSILEVIHHIEEILGRKMDLAITNPGNSKHKGSSIVSATRFSAATGLAPKVNLHEGLRKLMPRNIFFDLDGPILDVKERYSAVYRNFVLEHGGIPLFLEEYWKQKRMKTSLERLLELSGCAGLIEEHKKYLSRHREELSSLKLDKLQPQTRKVLAHLSQKYDLYLITLRRNKENLAWQLKELGLLPFFKAILSVAPNSEDKWKHKVDLLVKHHLQHQSGIIIGDTPTEVIAGKKIGLTTIGVSNGIRTKEILSQAEPHLVVESIGDLQSLPFFKLGYDKG